MPALPLPASSLSLLPPQKPCVPTPFPALTAALSGGLPRGAISEFTGPRSSGKTALALTLLAQASQRGEFCAWIDATNAFDPASTARAGAASSRLLWIRADHDADAALQATDLLLRSGGFGFVCLDLADLPPRTLHSVPANAWFRYRHAIEHTSTILLVLSPAPVVRSAALRTLECRQSGICWTGSEHVLLLDGLRLEAAPRKPARPAVSLPARITHQR